MLEQSYWLSCGYNIIAYHEAERIISSFNRDKIPVIVLKGLALADFIYPHIGMRKMTDIDILIKNKDLSCVCERLENLGFKLQPGHSSFLFLKQESVPIYVDLHTGIPYLKEQDIWDTTRTVQINEIEVKTLSLEQSIIYFCYHLAVSHASVENRWFEDIHRFIEKYGVQIHWQYIVEKVKEYKLGIPVYWCLKRVQENFGTPIPDLVFTQLKPATSLKSNVFKSILKNQKPIPGIDYVSTVLFFSPGYLLSVAFPPVDFLKLRYNTNSPKVYFYYFIRPFSLLSDLVKGTIGLIFSS